MLSKFAKLAALIVLSLGARAHADLLLEPYIGYEAAGAKATLTSANSDVSYLAGGVVVGGRIGYAMPLLWFALDYSVANGMTSKVDAKPSGTNFIDGTMDRTTAALVAGVKIPFLQAYVGYAPLNSWKLKENGNETTFNGTGVKLGAGFTGFPIISLNLEYLMSTGTKYKNSSGEFDLGSSTTWSKATENSLMLTVSAPFRL